MVWWLGSPQLANAACCFQPRLKIDVLQPVATARLVLHPQQADFLFYFIFYALGFRGFVCDDGTSELSGVTAVFS